MWGLVTILENLGQREVKQEVEAHAVSGEPVEPIDLAPITQPDWSMTQRLLADFKQQYMLRLLSAYRGPRIRLRDKITGRDKEIQAYFDYTTGRIEGKYEELSGFLQTIGYTRQMDSIQQQADRMIKRDPRRIWERINAVGVETSIANLREAAQDLEDDDLITLSEEPPEHE